MARRDADGRGIAPNRVVIATGGLTVPKIGATPFGYRIAEQFGLAVVPPSPALVPLALPPDDTRALRRSRGHLRSTSRSRAADGRFRENLLFTHRGLSGPAILQISSYWNGSQPLVIDVLPGIDAGDVLRRAGSPARLDNVLARRLPQRFAQAWCAAKEAALPVSSFRRSGCAIAPRCSRLDVAAVRDARLQQGRGHAGRRRHARSVEKTMAATASGALISSAKSST